MVEELKARHAQQRANGYDVARVFVGLGDKDGAIASLEKAYAAHDLQLQFLKVDPNYDSLRADPRFQDLIRRVGLAS